MTYIPYKAPSVVPTGPCSCARSHHHYSDPHNGRGQACCLQCYAHWWTDEARRPLDDFEPFSPYTYVLAAMGEIAPPPPKTPAAHGLLARITHLNFWQTTLNPEYGGFAGDWEWLERFAIIGAADVSSLYQSRHQSGDESALPEFLKRWPHALEQQWVTTQLTAWRVEGTSAALAKLNAALTAFTDSRGRGSARTGDLRRNIERNIAVYEAVHTLLATGFNVRGAISDVSERFRMGHESVREIYEEYERARKWHADRREREVSVDDCAALLRQIASRLPTGEE